MVLAGAAALLIVVGAAVGVSQGKGVPGIFEARMVDVNTGNGNVTVAGSEGEIKLDGTFEVEVPGAPAGTYKLCLF